MPINYVYINFKQPQILICSITFELYACIKFLKLALSFLASYIQILSNLIYKPKNTKIKQMQSNTTSSFTVEEWYNELKQITMPTIFMPLNQKERECIIAIYDVIYAEYFRQLNYRNRSKPGQNISQLQGGTNWLFIGLVQRELKERELLHTRNQLLSKISLSLKQDHHYFAKLSLRSAKDSLALNKYKQKLSKNYTQQQSFALHGEFQRLCQRVSTSSEILEVMCSSQRIKDDLKRLQKQKNYEVNLVVREWRTIPACLEFRGFMNNRKLTALCSYYKSERHPWLMKYREQLKNQINNFFQKYIKQKVPYNEAVFDFGLELPEKDICTNEEIKQEIKCGRWRLVMIEINPFSKATGAALFSWQFDKEILQNGPLVFRLSGEEDFN